MAWIRRNACSGADNKDLKAAHQAHATDYADILGKGAETDYKDNLGIEKPKAKVEAAPAAKPAAKKAEADDLI